MKVKSFCYRSIATLLCVVFLSLSVGGKFCYYNDISKSYAADPFTLTMGGVALEEVFMAIAVAILGYDVAYQYRDELVDAFKKGIAEEIANGNGVTLDNNMLTAYVADAVSPYTTSIPWSDYMDVINEMGSSASQTFDDIKDSLTNTYLKPSAKYLQYVAEWWGDFITENTMPNYEAVTESAYYIGELSEYMSKAYFKEYQINDAGQYIYWKFFAVDVRNF